MSSYSNYVHEDKKKTAHNIGQAVTINSEYVKRSFQETKGDWREYLSLWLMYPDYFIDFINPKSSNFQLFPFQRVFLRIFFRYRKSYSTFTRGTSKTFTSILASYLLCVFRPNIKKFIVAPGKEQAAKISQDNIEDIWKFLPILKNEVESQKFSKDYTSLTFRNGSRFDVVQASQAQRGGRRHGGSIEELVDEKNLKPEILNSVVIPLMAGNRLANCGGTDPYEIHKQEFYCTTAGKRQSFAFEKMMEVHGDMLLGKSGINIGSGYGLAVEYGNLDIDFITEKRNSPTFNILDFGREYNSEWTLTSQKALVPLDSLESSRILKTAESSATKEKGWEYVLSYDVARSAEQKSANSALVVIKIKDRGDGTYLKHVVNVFSMNGEHMESQAKFLKEMVFKFNAKVLVVDSNGLGKGLLDMLVMDIDENPRFSVINDDSFDKYKTRDSIPMVFSLSSNKRETNASDIHNVFMNMVSEKKVKFLVHSNSMKNELMKRAKNDSNKYTELVLPYALTDLMMSEITNLEYKQNGKRTEVVQVSKQINKDRFSALEYGLFWIYLEEQKMKIRKKENNWMDYCHY